MKKMRVDDLIAELERRDNPWRLDWSIDYFYKVIQTAIQVVQDHDSDTINFEDIVFLFADKCALKRAEKTESTIFWLLDDAEFVATEAFKGFS